MERLRRAGARVFVWDLAPTEIDGVTSLVVDLTDVAQLDAGLAQTLRVAGRIDILVNNAGYLGAYGPFEDLKAGGAASGASRNLSL